MKATKTQPPVIYGDDLPITTHQIKTINRHCQWNVDIKEEWVQWATGDVNRTSLKSLTQAQAVKIIRQQTGSPPTPKGGEKEENWGLFDKHNTGHGRIIANLYAAGLTTTKSDGTVVADMLGWFNRFLKSAKSPVKKPLKQMTPQEVSKIITALDGVAIWMNSI